FASARTMNIEVSEANCVERIGDRVRSDTDSITASVKDPGFDVRAVNNDGLGNDDSAESARINAVDLAVDGGFRNRTRKGFARRSAAARIRVVADARHPRARCLRLSERCKSEHEDRDCQYVDSEPKLVHLESPFFQLKVWVATSRTRIRSGHCCAESFPSLPRNVSFIKPVDYHKILIPTVPWVVI